MGCVKREMLKEASVQCVDESSIISSTHTLKVSQYNISLK